VLLRYDRARWKLKGGPATNQAVVAAFRDYSGHGLLRHETECCISLLSYSNPMSAPSCLSTATEARCRAAEMVLPSCSKTCIWRLKRRVLRGVSFHLLSGKPRSCSGSPDPAEYDPQSLSDCSLGFRKNSVLWRKRSHSTPREGLFFPLRPAVEWFAGKAVVRLAHRARKRSLPADGRAWDL